jgi:hypothetical protein
MLNTVRAALPAPGATATADSNTLTTLKLARDILQSVVDSVPQENSP